jgi:hypothetical protein
MEATSHGSNGPPQAQRHLKNFLIDKDFQLGWVLRVALVTGVILGVMGYFLYSTLSESTELIVGEALMVEGLSEVAQKAFIEQGQSDKLHTILVLGGGLVGLVVLLSLMTIIATHRIAGPAYKMRRLFATIDGDHLQIWAKLRKGDQLSEVFKDFDDMVRRLREARHIDIDELKRIESLLGEGRAEEAASGLERLLARYGESVKMV